jgi:lysyl-tRNA synthetase class 1
MFWADKEVQAIQERFPTGKLIVRDEKTASGRVHIGSMRGVAVHGLIADILKDSGRDVTFLYEINDFDPMDGLPSDLDAATWAPHLGKPLKDVPSPDGKAANFAEYYAEEFKTVIAEARFTPTYYRNSELYQDGRMDEAIRLALDNAATIRRIYKEVSGSDKKEDWLPISMRCEQCGKIGTTQGYAWDGERVSYRCTKGPGGAEGCGHEGVAAPWKGASKLPWKVEWPAKWKAVGVHVEGAGKDHSTKGGARDVANAIAKEVFGIESPHDVPYEFFLDKDGKKMSSSKGRGTSSREIADNFPPTILRLALIGKDRSVQTSIDPQGELLALLYDWHDKLAEKYWDGIGDDDARLFELLYRGHPPHKQYLPRFSTVTFVCQMTHLSPHTEFAALKEAHLTDEEKRVIDERTVFAKKWLETYAPDKYKFILQKEVPPVTATLSDTQKQALTAVLAFVESRNTLDGPTLHTELHDIKTRLAIPAKELFSALYLSFLGRDSGPQAGWFLSTLDKQFLCERLRAVTTV